MNSEKMSEFNPYTDYETSKNLLKNSRFAELNGIYFSFVSSTIYAYKLSAIGIAIFSLKKNDMEWLYLRTHFFD